jgi:hypothetical protein
MRSAEISEVMIRPGLPNLSTCLRSAIRANADRSLPGLPAPQPGNAVVAGAGTGGFHG